MLRHSYNKLLAKYNQLFHRNTSEGADELEVCCICKLRHKEVNATHQCLDCLDTLCGDCQGRHLSSRATIAHTVVPIQEVIMGRSHLKRWKASAQICPTHFGEHYRYFCRSCSIVICSICFLKQHKEHDVDTTKTVAEEFQTKLKMSSTFLNEQNHVTIVEYRLGRFEEMRKKTEEKKECLLGEIHSICQKDTSYILKNESRAVSSVVKYCDGQIQYIKSSAEEVKEREDIAKTTSVMLNNILTDEDSSSCLLLHDDIKAIMQEYDRYKEPRDIQDTHALWRQSFRLSPQCMGDLHIDDHETPPVRHISLKQRKVDMHWEDISEEQILHFGEKLVNEITDSDEESNPYLRKKGTHQKIQLKRLEDTSNPVITAMSLTDEKDAKIVVSDSGNTLLRLITTCGVHVNTCTMDEDQEVTFHSITTLPNNIIFRSGSRLYITDTDLQPLRHIDLTNVVQNGDGDTFLALSKYTDSSVIIGNLPGNKIRIYNINGSMTSEQTTPVECPVVAISLQNKRLLYSSWHQPGAVYLVKTNGQMISSYRPPFVKTWYPEGACADADCNVYVADPWQSLIHVFKPDGTQLAGYSTLKDELHFPRCVVFTSDRYIFASGSNSFLFKYNVEDIVGGN